MQNLDLGPNFACKKMDLGPILTRNEFPMTYPKKGISALNIHIILIKQLLQQLEEVHIMM